MPIARAEELALLFTDARTHGAWLDGEVSEATLRRLYELTSAGPTGGNAHPLRVMFATTPAAKERLRPALQPQNVEKAMRAPVTAILAFDPAFHEYLPILFPARPAMREQLAAMPDAERDRLALLSATLQAGYLILAARALGLDCGPMGGFDRAQIDTTFFTETRWRSFLLVNLGYGDPSKLFPRLPRLAFEQACQVI